MQSLPQEALLAAFGQLAVSRNLIAQVRRGAHCKAGGLWGASAALLLTTLAREHKGALLVLTADDVDSMMLQNDMSAFGATSHVLVLPPPALENLLEGAHQLHAAQYVLDHLPATVAQAAQVVDARGLGARLGGGLGPLGHGGDLIFDRRGQRRGMCVNVRLCSANSSPRLKHGTPRSRLGQYGLASSHGWQKARKWAGSRT